MTRREFIALLGGAAAWPLAARAQQRERVRRVGVLTNAREANFPLISAVFRDELQKLGWMEGRNLQLDYRNGAGDFSRARAYAAELVKLSPDVLVISGGPALTVVQNETKAIPIVVMGAGDVEASGEVKNLAHPEGNTTGFTNAYNSLGGKWLELLKEVAPTISRVAFLFNRPSVPDRPNSYLPSVKEAAQALALSLAEVPVVDAVGMTTAVEHFAMEPNGGLLIGPGVVLARSDEMIRLIAQSRLPAIYGSRDFVARGGLISYDADLDEIQRGVAGYVDRLLRGAKVSDLPVQYPTKFRLVVNLKAAKAIGLTIPESFLRRADEVIE